MCVLGSLSTSSLLHWIPKAFATALCMLGIGILLCAAEHVLGGGKTLKANLWDICSDLFGDF
jgi:hypothetical protein